MHLEKYHSVCFLYTWNIKDICYWGPRFIQFVSDRVYIQISSKNIFTERALSFLRPVKKVVTSFEETAINLPTCKLQFKILQNKLSVTERSLHWKLCRKSLIKSLFLYPCLDIVLTFTFWHISCLQTKARYCVVRKRKVIAYIKKRSLY